MSNERKLPLALASYPSEFEKLQALSEKLKMSRSAVFDYAVGQCVDDPEVLVRIFKAIVDNASSEPTTEEKKSTSILVSAKTYDGIEAIGHKLGLTRNAVVALIMKGILNGGV